MEKNKVKGKLDIRCRAPEGEDFPTYMADAVRWYFCSRELYVAQALCRGFAW
jgi:hypothetical protein